ARYVVQSSRAPTNPETSRESLCTAAKSICVCCGNSKPDARARLALFSRAVAAKPLPHRSNSGSGHATAQFARPSEPLGPKCDSVVSPASPAQLETSFLHLENSCNESPADSPAKNPIASVRAQNRAAHSHQNSGIPDSGSEPTSLPSSHLLRHIAGNSFSRK